MPLFVMIAKDRPATGEQRTATRPVHMDHLAAMGDRLVFAGALMGDNGSPEGSLLVLEADNLEAAKAVLLADPFVQKAYLGL